MRQIFCLLIVMSNFLLGPAIAQGTIFDAMPTGAAGQQVHRQLLSKGWKSFSDPKDKAGYVTYFHPHFKARCSLTIYKPLKTDSPLKDFDAFVTGVGGKVVRLTKDTPLDEHLRLLGNAVRKDRTTFIDIYGVYGQNGTLELFDYTQTQPPNGFCGEPFDVSNSIRSIKGQSESGVVQGAPAMPPVSEKRYVECVSIQTQCKTNCALTQSSCFMGSAGSSHEMKSYSRPGCSIEYQQCVSGCATCRR